MYPIAIVMVLLIVVGAVTILVIPKLQDMFLRKEPEIHTNAYRTQ